MTPYGYRIREGKAQIETNEAQRLRTFFKLYLNGFTIDDAAHDAGINRSQTAYRAMLSNQVYLGNVFYPRIIPDDVFQKVQSEREKRNTRPPGIAACKLLAIPPAKSFRLSKPSINTEEMSVSDIFTALYNCIQFRNDGVATSTLSTQEMCYAQELFADRK